MAKHDNEELTMSIWPEFGKAIGAGKSKAYEEANSGRWPVIRIGKSLRVLRRPFRKMMGADDAA